MDEWLTRARDAVVDAAGLPRDELEVDEDTAKTLLDLARVAAHTSGDRRNAPLLTYVVGRAATRADVHDLAAAVRAAQR